MRLRRCIAVSLLFIAQSTHQASAQASPSSTPQQPAAPSAAGRRLNTDGMSRFELQRLLAELDERRRRLRSSIDPADSALRLFAADTLRIRAAARPAAITQDSATVHQLFLELRQAPPAASRDLRNRLLTATEATANDFSSVEMGLTSRIANAQIARDFLERSPFAAVIPISQNRPVENTRLVEELRGLDDGRPDAARMARADLTDFESALSDSAFQAYKAGLMSAYAARVADVRALTKADHDELTRVQEDAAQVSRDIGQRQDDQAKLDTRLVYVGLPVVGIALIVLVLAPLLYKSEELRRSIVTSGMLVELVTVFLLTAAVIILGIGGRIQAEVIGTLLGGVSGYVLGRAVNPPARG